MKNTVQCKKINKPDLFAKRKDIATMTAGESERSDAIKYPRKMSKNTTKIKK